MAKRKKHRKPTQAEYKVAYIKAAKKGAREAELENATGFVAKNKVHKNKKAYSRKNKHKVSF